jgi:hypothetical protein
MTTSSTAPKLTRAEAARLNGARSRGPVTEDGKRRAAQNALKHGLSAETHCVLETEDPAAFRALRDRLVAHHRPNDPDRVHLVERLASVMWRQRRLDRLEAAIFDEDTYTIGPQVKLHVDIPSYEALQRACVRLNRELFQLLKALRESRPEDDEVPDPPANDDDAPVPNEPKDPSPAPTPPRASTAPNEPDPALVAELETIDEDTIEALRDQIRNAGPAEKIELAKAMELAGLIDPDTLRRILDLSAEAALKGR